MTRDEYLSVMNRIADAPDAASGAALLAAHPFSDEWQLRDALTLADTPDEARTILDANPVLAQRVARETAMMADLNRRDPVADALAAALKACTTPQEAAALLVGVSPEVYADAAAQLALSRYSADEIGRRYKTLVLGEVSDQ